jgi:hypothetical protein
MKIVKFKVIEHGINETAVLVAGLGQVGRTRKRHESYSGIQGGGRYSYYDFYAGDSREKLSTGSTRKGAVAEGLIRLSQTAEPEQTIRLREAAVEVDSDTARHYARNLGVTL